MKNQMQGTLVAALFILLTTLACQSDQITGSADTLSSIPADVTMVTSIDLPQLLEKADFEQVKQMEFYQAFILEVAEENPALAYIFKDPAASGIDLTKNINIAVLPNPQNPEETFTALVANLSDEAAFTSLVQSTANSTITEQAGFKSYQANRNNIVAWNEKVAVVGFANGAIDVISQVEKIFNTDASTSVIGNKDLKKAMQGDHDITSWLSTNSLAENPQAQFALSMAQLDPEALKDNFIHASMDFEPGEVRGHLEYFMNKALTKEFDKFFNDKVTTDFSDDLPGEGLLFAMTNALNLKGIDETLSARPQSKGFLEYALKEYGLTVEDIIQTFGGDILLAGYAGADGKKGAGVFATNILDRKKLDTFLKLAEDYDMLEPEGENLYKITKIGFGGMDGNFSIRTKDGFSRLLVTNDKLFISGDDAILAQIQEGGFPKAERINKDILSLLNSHLFAGFVGLDAIQKMDEDLRDLQLQELKISTSRKESDLLLEMKEKEENALKSIFEMINASYLKSKEKEAI